MEIRIDGECLDLTPDFNMNIEETNPVLNEVGSQSLPGTVPVTRQNMRILSLPHRLDVGADPNLQMKKAYVMDGAFIRSGSVNVTEAGKSEGITFNIGFDNSEAYSKWKNKQLQDLSGLPVFIPDENIPGMPVEQALRELYRIYSDPRPDDDFAVFPVAISKETYGSDKEEKVYWEILNIPANGEFLQPESVRRIIDGEVLEVTIPEGYCISPFLRVWKILELIFLDLGVTLKNNPFREIDEFRRLVVLNNVADSVCLGSIKYSDLLPSCSVESFLNALKVRFGLIYNIDGTTGTAELRFIKDIIARRSVMDLSPYVSGFPKISYKEKQYLTLRASTSLEGAAPACERFEEFSSGMSLKNLKQGADVSDWKNVGTQESPKWDGDIRDEYDDYFEREDERDDYNDDYFMIAPDNSSAANNTFLAREFISGLWYRLDSMNGTVKEGSTGFFNWDPQSPGLEALEFSSEDECVPIQRVNNAGTFTGHLFNDFCPLYLSGSRHFHSYIKGNDSDKDSGESTPLAFMLAFEKDGKTVGRIFPENSDGSVITASQEEIPSFSLVFQFKDGLFSQFWKEYDDILRHSNRFVTVNLRLPKTELQKINILDIYTLQGVRCMISKLTYTLPSGNPIEIEAELFPVQTHGEYDIEQEQNIPDFSAIRRLVWKLQSETFGSSLNSSTSRKAAADLYILNNGYTSHGGPGDYWYVGAESAILKDISRVTTWETDSELENPNNSKQEKHLTYMAALKYEIFEVHDMAEGPGEENKELAGKLGEVTIEVPYNVIIKSGWVIS